MRASVSVWLVLVSLLALGPIQAVPGFGQRDKSEKTGTSEAQEPNAQSVTDKSSKASSENPTEVESGVRQVGDLGQRIVKLVERSQAAGFSGVVLAAKKGTVVAAMGVGFADLERKVPITPDVLFDTASATKQFTAAATVRLAQEGRLQLEDSIAVHLPGVPQDCEKISVRHLLQHTSGIPGTNMAGSGTNLGEVLPLFLRGGPVHPPGTHWEYWNQGYALLSEVIARASGKAYTEYCQSVLFEAANMSSTRFTGDQAPEGATVAIGTSLVGPPRSALDHPYGSYGFQYRGMGGVVTNVWDLWRWDRALAGTEVLTNESKQELFQPSLNDYALGWFVRKNSRGQLVHSHSGKVRGFVCEVRRYPEEDGCLFVLCNRDNAPVHQVANAIEEYLFEEIPKVVEPVGR
jgi:CubicO group peptidase (beta-lactamase class C family)